MKTDADATREPQFLLGLCSADTRKPKAFRALRCRAFRVVIVQLRGITTR